jgi:hypothetical protein
MTDEKLQAGANDRTAEATTEPVAQQPRQSQETVADKPETHPSAGRRPLFGH